MATVSLAWLVMALHLTPHTYACRGGSDELRSAWHVWAAVVERRCVVIQ